MGWVFFPVHWEWMEREEGTSRETVTGMLWSGPVCVSVGSGSHHTVGLEHGSRVCLLAPDQALLVMDLTGQTGDGTQACTALELVLAQKGGRNGGGGLCWLRGGTGVWGQMGWRGAGCRWELCCREDTQDLSMLCRLPLWHCRDLPLSCPLPANDAGGGSWSHGDLHNLLSRF